jgi:hypothetical protein
MWITHRVGRNTAITAPVWPLALLGVLAFGIVAATIQTLAQMPWSYWAWFSGAGVVMFVLYAVGTHRIHGVWPWQPLPLDLESDEA